MLWHGLSWGEFYRAVISLSYCNNFTWCWEDRVLSKSTQLLQIWCAVCLVAQLCLTLCDPMDYSPPGSSVHEILQTRILEWVAMVFSRGSSQPRDRTWVSCIAGRRFILWATREAPLSSKGLWEIEDSCFLAPVIDEDKGLFCRTHPWSLPQEWLPNSTEDPVEAGNHKSVVEPISSHSLDSKIG